MRSLDPALRKGVDVLSKWWLHTYSFAGLGFSVGQNYIQPCSFSVPAC